MRSVAAFSDGHLGHNAETVLSYVPRWRTEQVCYLNVADLERPVGLNILAGHDPAFRHRITAAGYGGSWVTTV